MSKLLKNPGGRIILFSILVSWGIGLPIYWVTGQVPTVLLIAGYLGSLVGLGVAIAGKGKAGRKEAIWMGAIYFGLYVVGLAAVSILFRSIGP